MTAILPRTENQKPKTVSQPKTVFSSLISARFLRRQKRFLAEVELTDGARHWVHVPNSGALTGCLRPGQEILLTQDDKAGRKTAYTWRFCRVEDEWVCIDTLVPNRLITQSLLYPGLPGLPPIARMRPEVTVAQGSRLDFVVESSEGLIFIEVKSVTWLEDGVALFPDGVTSRGRRHLQELAKLVRQGHSALQVFVVQRQGAHLFRPAVRVDPAYARELTLAAQQGVKILVLTEKVSPPEITLAATLPFDLT
jgi:sugar fermentation stimulation protein A